MKVNFKGEKHPPASFLLFIVLLLVLLLTAKLNRDKFLIISSQETGKEYYRLAVKEGDSLSFNWIHSLEKIPWLEEYRILDNNSFLLERIELVAFGAGIPHNKGEKTSIRDGIIIMDEINEEFKEINWFHSQTAIKSIDLNNEIWVEGKELLHQEALNLKIEKRLVLWLKQLKTFI